MDKLFIEIRQERIVLSRLYNRCKKKHNSKLKAIHSDRFAALMAFKADLLAEQ